MGKTNECVRCCIVVVHLVSRVNAIGGALQGWPLVDRAVYNKLFEVNCQARHYQHFLNFVQQQDPLHKIQSTKYKIQNTK